MTFRGWNRCGSSCPATASRPTAGSLPPPTGSHPAFSASYDLVTDEAGETTRLSLTVTLAERERQLSIARDEENMWLVQDHTGQTKRVGL